jgi:hypothetical protein
MPGQAVALKDILACDTGVHAMPDFEGLIEKAKDLAGKHPDQVHKGVEKAEEIAEKKLGGQFDGQIEQAGNLVEGFLGVHEPE